MNMYSETLAIVQASLPHQNAALWNRVTDGLLYSPHGANILTQNARRYHFERGIDETSALDLDCIFMMEPRFVDNFKTPNFEWTLPRFRWDLYVTATELIGWIDGTTTIDNLPFTCSIPPGAVCFLEEIKILTRKDGSRYPAVRIRAQNYKVRRVMDDKGDDVKEYLWRSPPIAVRYGTVNGVERKADDPLCVLLLLSINSIKFWINHLGTDLGFSKEGAFRADENHN